ncbi:hypothetical protein ACJJTC_011635 [Scirpophaga incertulas]
MSDKILTLLILCLLREVACEMVVSLVIHKFSGFLFFSHTIESSTEIDFGISSCHISKRTCSNITGVPGGFTIAYDQGNDDIFFGGHDGIYKYNFLTKSADFFAENGKSIWSLFVKRKFYYIQYPSQKLHVYQGDNFVPVAEAVNYEIDQFFISKLRDVYYSNRTALYKVEKFKKESILLNDDIAVRQIVEDSYGDIYFCCSDGIYIEDKPYRRIKMVAQINEAFGLAFDEHDNVIYSDQRAIYRLLPSKHSELCYQAITISLKKYNNTESTFSV